MNSNNIYNVKNTITTTYKSQIYNQNKRTNTGEYITTMTTTKRPFFNATTTELDRIMQYKFIPDGDGTGPKGNGSQDGSGSNQGSGKGKNQSSSGAGSGKGKGKGNC